ncbi:MAG: PEP-CTERM sorting domain-containing protein [Phycisphaerales bacterium]|nr:PEP-CTERM sorting domain-containing protein [Phycisphaerales bacterium]
MHSRTRLSVITTIAALSSTAGVASASIYDEGVDGDLASVALGPTMFDVGVGNNSVFGTIGDTDFEDFIGFTIDAGEQLTAITLTSFVVANGNTSTGFRLYTDQGSGWFQASAGSMTPASVGTNFLDVWDLSDVGGSSPLGPGSYGVVLAEFTPGQTYSFDITVTPAPGSLALLGLSGLAITRRRR